MAVLREDTTSNSAAPTPSALRAGLPAWISEELIQETLTAWQPYYRQVLSDADAIGILRTMGRLVDVLESGNEKV